MSERLPFRMLIGLMDYGIMLPLSATYDSPRVAVRLAGLLWQFIWFIPAMFLCVMPLIIVLVAVLVDDTIHGY